MIDSPSNAWLSSQFRKYGGESDRGPAALAKGPAAPNTSPNFRTGVLSCGARTRSRFRHRPPAHRQLQPVVRRQVAQCHSDSPFTDITAKNPAPSDTQNASTETVTAKM